MNEEPTPAALDAARRDRSNVFGKYVRLQPIGEGGFATVYLAWDETLKRRVAMKFLHGAEPEDLERFAREARTAARLSHPNIVPVYDVGGTDERPYIVMEYVAGAPAGDAPLDPRRAASIAIQVAGALRHAHEHGVIHRDLKPDNILLVGETAMVTDFGLAKSLSGEKSLSMTGEIMGTPRFMAPEQARGRHDLVDARTDVWGLGATLYALCAGHGPFAGDDVFEIVKNVLGADPPPPPADPDLATIVLKCLEKEPSRRYASAAELGEDLRRYLAGEPIVARAPSALYRVRKRVGRNPWAWGLGTAAAALTLIAAGAVFAADVLRRRALERDLEAALREIERDIAQTELEMATQETDVVPILAAFDPMIARLREILVELPDADGYHALGKVLTRQGKLDEAADALRESRRLNPDHRRAREQLALVYLALSRRYVGLSVVGHGVTSRAMMEQDRDELIRLAAAEMRHAGGDPGMAAALDAFAAGDFHEAKRLALDAHRTRRWPAEGLKLVGQFEMMDEHWIEAHAFFAEAQATWRSDWEAMRLAAEAKMQIAELSIAVNQDPLPALGEAAAWLERAEQVKRDDAAILAVRAWTDGRTATHLIQRGRDPSAAFASALERLDRSLAIDSTSAFAYNARASILATRAHWERVHGRDPSASYEAAIADAGSAIELAPAMTAAYNNRGVVRAGFGHARGDVELVREGISDLDRAVESDPRYAEAYMNRAGAWLMLHEMGERGDALRHAEADASAAIAVHPGFGEAIATRGTARLLLARRQVEGGAPMRDAYRPALDDFAEALRLRSDHAPAMINRAQALRDLAQLALETGGDPTDDAAAAIADLDVVIELNPQDAKAIQTRGAVRLIQGQYEGDRGVDPIASFRAAEADAARAIEIHGGFAPAYLTRGMAREATAVWEVDQGNDPAERVKSAVEDFRTALNLDPSEWHAPSNEGGSLEVWARYLIARGRDDEAKEKLRAAVRAYERALAIDASAPVADRVKRIRAALEEEF